VRKQIALTLCFISIVAVGALGFQSKSATAAAEQRYSNEATEQLIDDLTQIDSQSLGIDGAAMYGGFLADNAPPSFEEGVLGVVPPSVPPQMRELVRRGPSALPELIKHVGDARATKLKVGNDDSGNSLRRVGVNFFMFSYFSDEYDPRLPRHAHKNASRDGLRPMEKDFHGQYTVKIGDVCYVLIGQIVNRRLLAVRYQPSAGLVINSPIEVPALAERVRQDWGNSDAETIKASLLSDIREGTYVNGALERLRLYFPDTYNALQGSDLRKRTAFEAQEAKQTGAR
jgi:hypothetical protein